MICLCTMCFRPMKKGQPVVRLAKGAYRWALHITDGRSADGFHRTCFDKWHQPSELFDTYPH